MVNPFENPYHAIYPNWVDRSDDFFTTIASHCKPAYMPFPERYITSLPPTIDPKELKGCFCPTCASELWGKLPSYSAKLDPVMSHSAKLNPVIDENGKVRLAKHDLRQIVDMFSSNLNRILSGDMSAKEQESLDYVLEFMKFLMEAYQLNHHKLYPTMMPMLPEFAEGINQLFFGGLLINLKYEWAKPKSIDPQSIFGTGYGVYRRLTALGPCVLINPEIYWGQGVCQTLSRAPAKLVQQLVTTIIHEQIHATFDLYSCKGWCGVTDPIAFPDFKESPYPDLWHQSQLCEYLYIRMVDNYNMFEYKGRILHHPTAYPLGANCGYPMGHGPAFTTVTRMFRKVLTKLFKFDEQMELQHTSPECGDNCADNACWSHCYGIPWEAENIKSILEEIKDRGPWPPSWIPWPWPSDAR